MKATLDYLALGKRVRELREGHRITRESLAQRCGITVPFLCGIEQGTRRAGAQMLVTLAVNLEVSLDGLMRDAVRLDEDLWYLPPLETNYYAEIRRLLDRAEAASVRNAMR